MLNGEGVNLRSKTKLFKNGLSVYRSGRCPNPLRFHIGRWDNNGLLEVFVDLFSKLELIGRCDRW